VYEGKPVITFTKPRTENGVKIAEVKASEEWNAPTLLRIFRRNAKSYPPRNADPGWGVEEYSRGDEYPRCFAGPLRGLNLREAKDLAVALVAVDKGLWSETAAAWWEARQYRKDNP
jgi:hypothetical protein